jgi:glycosyltransferase involved in cell wall biosynthesis
MKKKKVLALFDYVARTGFGTVSKNIVAQLKKNFGDNLHLDIIAINYFGESYKEDENTFVFPAKLTDEKSDDFGRYAFLKMLKESNDYDGIFICQDLGVIVPIIEVMDFIKKEKKQLDRKSFKSIFYFPVDCELKIEELTRGLEFFDVLVTYTEFGRGEVLKFRPDLKVKVILHGNNSKDFYPLPDDVKLKFRNEYFGDNAGKFIVTNVNRNQPRKDIPNTIFGFIEARASWDNANKDLPRPFLYLHCHPKDPLGWDIRAIMAQTDLEEDVDYKLIPKEMEASMADVATLNAIYNASDVFLTTTLGEGFGLSFADAAACKVPIIAPYTTSFMEMSANGNNAYILTTLYPFCSPTDNIIREQTDIYEVASRIVEVAEAKYGTLPEPATILQGKVSRSYEWVKKLEWSNVCKQWIEYFKIF